MLLRRVGLHNKNFFSAHFENFHFLAFFSDLENFQKGRETKLLDRFGSNFFCGVYGPIGSPEKKCLLLGQLFQKSGHPKLEY